MDAARLAVIGAGVIGTRHIAAIADCEDAKLVAVADPNEATKRVAEDHGAAWFGDCGQMLASVGPDGVVVATPTEHHLQPALSALRAGAHVLIEKPIAATAEEAQRIARESRETGRHVLVGHHRRYYPLVERARELVSGGAIGQLVAVSGQWTVLKPPAYFAADWRKKRAAGPVLTNLVHEIDTLRYICGEVTSVSAGISSGVLGMEKEDVAALTIGFASGALGAMVISDQTPSPWAWEFATGENPAFPRSGQNACRFMGTEAALDFPNLTLWTHEAGESGWNHRMNPQALESALCDAFIAQCRHFCAVIRSEAAPHIDAEDGARSLRVTLAVFESAETGRHVSL